MKGTEYGLVETLSPKEIEVLGYVVDGLSNAEISKKLYISIGTVKTHINTLFRKLDVETRVQAVRRAKELNLIKE
ncbi:MAG TPA: response regulator transcription factor [Anaerolineaceae bacterium]|nr:response regulator transcription factor [Anaerolineaceae bacterium]